MAHSRGSGQRRADMAIATKNGVPIIQGGRITTACSCCTQCLPIEERTFRGQQYGDNIYTISVPPQAGQFTFTNVQCGAATGAGSTCFNWPITYRVKAGGVVLHEAGCVSSDIVLCKPEGVTSIEVNIFVHQPAGQFAYCLGQISFPRGLARIGCLDTRTGACCNGTTCSVKPQCQCNAAAGEVFKGVGTVCSPNPCSRCGCETTDFTPESLSVAVRVNYTGVQQSPGFPAVFECPQDVLDRAVANIQTLLDAITFTAPRIGSGIYGWVGSATVPLGDSFARINSGFTAFLPCSGAGNFVFDLDGSIFIQYQSFWLNEIGFPSPLGGSFNLPAGFPCGVAAPAASVFLPSFGAKVEVIPNDCTNDFGDDVSVFIQSGEIVITPNYANPLP